MLIMNKTSIQKVFSSFSTIFHKNNSVIGAGQCAAPDLLPHQSSSLTECLTVLTDSRYVTVKEACNILKVSRTKLTKMRNKRELTSIVINRRVRLIRTEVEQAISYYSIPKGKV